MAWTSVVQETATTLGNGTGGRGIPPQAASANPGSIGNGWIDNTGNTYSLGGTSGAGTIVVTTTDGVGYKDGTGLLRPVGEAATSARIVATYNFTNITNGNPGSPRPLLSPRWISANVYYFSQISASGTGSFSINCCTSAAGGTISSPLTGSSSGTGGTASGSAATYTLGSGQLVAGDQYQIDIYATGTSPTILSSTLTNVTTSTVICTCVATDSTAGLQVAGQQGIISYAPTAGDTATGFYTAVATYSGTPPSTTYTDTGPSSGTVSVASTAFTVTPNFGGPSASTIITLSDGGAGGTFTIGGTVGTTLTFAANTVTPQTYTYTPASTGVKTLSSTNNGGLTDPANISYTSNAGGGASIAVSPTTIAARQPAPSRLAASPSSGNVSAPNTGGVTVTVTGTGTNFTSVSQFTIHGGFGDQARSASGTGGASLIYGSISGQVATLHFDPGPFFATTPYLTPGATTWGALTITDTVSSATASIVVGVPTVAPAFPPGQTTGNTINILFVGDSISASDVNTASPDTQQQYGTLSSQTVGVLQTAGYNVGWAANAAVDGSWTQQWLPTPYYSHNAGDSTVSPFTTCNIWLKFPSDGATSTGHLTNNHYSSFDLYGTGTTAGCYFNRALAAAAAARGGSTTTPNTTVDTVHDYVHIMLYTNEITGNTTHPKGPLTVANHKANMAQLVAAFVALGYKVILSKPPYTWPYANTASGLPWPPCDNSGVTGAGWPAGFTSYTTQYPHEVYQLMWEADQPLIDGVNVFVGDTEAFVYSMANPTTFLQQAPVGGVGGTAFPGIHPAAAWSPLYAQMWANGISYAFGASNGTAPAATQVYIAAETTNVVGTALLLTFFLDAPAPSGGVSITPTITSGGGTLGAMSGTIAAGSTGPVTCSYTAASTGAKVISFTNSASLTNTGSPFTTTASASGTAPAATQVFIAGQSTSVVSVALTLSFFLDAGAPTGGVTITPAITSGGGTLGAMSGTIAAGSIGPVTCTYTPATAGAKVISFTNNATLTNTGSPFTTTASAAGTGTPWVHG